MGVNRDTPILICWSPLLSLLKVCERAVRITAALAPAMSLASAHTPALATLALRAKTAAGTAGHAVDAQPAALFHFGEPRSFLGGEAAAGLLLTQPGHASLHLLLMFGALLRSHFPGRPLAAALAPATGATDIVLFCCLARDRT